MQRSDSPIKNLTNSQHIFNNSYKMKQENLDNSKYFNKSYDNEVKQSNIQYASQSEIQARQPFKFANGATYNGQWVGNVRQGYGI